MIKFSKKQIEEMKSAGRDYARDFTAQKENKKKTERELRGELESCTSDLALSWSKTGYTYDNRAEVAADFVMEGIEEVLKELFQSSTIK